MAEAEYEREHGDSSSVSKENRFRRDLSSPVNKKFNSIQDDERVFKTKGSRPSVSRNRGPAMKKVSAEEYRNFMAAQGFKFRKV